MKAVSERRPSRIDVDDDDDGDARYQCKYHISPDAAIVSARARANTKARLKMDTRVHTID